jgi:hypothetical protein
MMVLQPLENIPESCRKIVWPNEFQRKNYGREQIKNVLNISEAKLRLKSPYCIKVYVGNTPPIHRLMMMGHLLAAPEGYAHYNNAKRNVVLLLQSH